ncbi:type IVB secretion system protein IcmH/DotU [Sulfurimonas sp. MAG313]|nr:type IVB secretion system protein IcmH/DotU [Sulfurimonas sp. MAG313]MDF1880500.1 type IVB secretion system protein IcmH/DotU [Sulfurimonas sp. MAG313]
MSATANKTMLVPVSHGTDSLTNFEPVQESYEHFKNTTISKAKSRDYSAEHAYEGTGNPLLSLSSDIFKQIDTLQNSYDIGSIEEVRNPLIEDITYFTNASGKKGIENSQVMLARYILCTFSDELICTTYWGKDSNWANSSLLGHFYNETYGGDKFFQILEQLLRAPAKYLDLLELMYICLSLGFEGKYRIQNRGKMELDAIRESLYRQMKMMNVRETQNFYGTQKVSSQRNHLVYKTSYQILGLSIVLMLSLVYGILSFSLAGKEDKALALFQNKYNKYTSEIRVLPTRMKRDDTSHPAMNAPMNEVPQVTIKDINE